MKEREIDSKYFTDGAGKPDSEKDQSVKREGMNRRAFTKGILGMGVLGSIPFREPSHSTVIPPIERELGNLEKVEDRINREIRSAEKILVSGSPDGIFESRYLAAMVYYSDAFMAKLRSAEPSNPSYRIFKGLGDKFTPDVRKKFIVFLRNKVNAKGGVSDETVPPLTRFDYGHGHNHPDAIDLFVGEGASVKSMSGGIVILAEGGWKDDDPFSTSSSKGGNTVIVFNTSRNEFYRYCHLEQVSVKIGEIVDAGHSIGTVGHSGINASMPGHGEHLHLEVNRYDEVNGYVRAENTKELKNNLDRSILYARLKNQTKDQKS